MNPPSLSVVVPVYRSAAILPKLLARLESSLSATFPDWEAILVNDGSPDNSWQIASGLVEFHPFLVAVDLRKNRGQDNALMAGLRLSRGENVVVMDDDLQHDPADIPRLLERLAEGFDVCYADFRTKKQSWWKNLGSAFNGWVARWVLGKPRDVYLSPFKAMSRGVVDSVLAYEGPYPYLDGLLFSVTDSFAGVELVHHRRLVGRGNYDLARSIGVWLKHATGFSVLPLRIASLAGIAMSALSFAFGAGLIARWFLVHTEVEGWTSTLVVVAFLGGIQLLSLGLLGEYVGRAYLTLNRKPQATIREILRNPDRS